MNAIQGRAKPLEEGAQGWLWDPMRTPALARRRAAVARERSVVDSARALLQKAVRGHAGAAAELELLNADLVARARVDPRACEILAAMSASGLGSPRSAPNAREWIMRAIRLLEDRVRRPIAGDHGFMLLAADQARNAYRPLYTAEGVLVTDEIGTARIAGGEVCFDRWGRPVLTESAGAAGGPARATPQAVAARIARHSTLEDFVWACRRTTPQFRLALIDARVIAHGRMGFQRYAPRSANRFAAAA